MESSSIFKSKTEKFSVIASRDNPKKSLISDDFTLPNNLKFCLWFYPTNIDEGSKNHSSLYLHPRNLSKTNSVTLKYKLWIEDSNGTIIRQSHESTREFKGKDGLGWGYPEFVEHNKLYPSAEGGSVLKDDIVVIWCEIKTIKLKRNILSDSELKLREQIYSGIIDNEDKCLIQVGKKEFGVSKGILMSYSNVFERMLTSGMKESQTSTIKIDDATPEVVESFLKYLYFGNIDNIEEMAVELFVLSDKYEEECVEILSNSNTKDNIFDRLKLAFMHGSEEFRKKLLTYVCDPTAEGNFQEILKMNEWRELTIANKVLTDEIIDAVHKKMWNK